MASVDGVTPTKGDNDGIPYRQAPSIAGGYGVVRRYGDCRERHWRGHRGRGALGPATSPARPGGLGATPAAADVGTATASARTLSSVPSLLTGSVSKTSCRLVCQDILQGRIGVWLQ